jgi:hypothetical protein
MKNTLYDIKQEYLTLINEIEEMEGEITPEIEYQLKINQSELQTKAIAYHSIILTKDAFSITIDNEIKRLQALKKRNNNLVDKLKNSLISAVEMFGEFTIGTNVFGLRRSERVEIEDVNLLSKEYKTSKLTEHADKALIKKALKQGKEIEYAYIVENFNLKIK